jgi:very-short-patch-repair endonuclease
MNHNEKQGCLAAILHVLGLRPKPAEPEVLPYRLRDDFLSPAELNFYRVLQTAVGDWAVICPKVSLDDLFYAKSGDHRLNVAYQNKIARKHVDFLLCDSQSIRPLLGVELDDLSHRRATRQERDRLVEQVFAVAGLPLQRVPVRVSYNIRELAATLRQRAGVKQVQETLQESSEVSLQTDAVGVADKLGDATPPLAASEEAPPLCPRCGQPMVLRVVRKEGPRKGQRFWGCQDYPRCRGTRAYASEGDESSAK